MAHGGDLSGSAAEFQPLIEELYTTRFEDLDTGSKEEEKTYIQREHLYSTGTRTYERRQALFNSRAGHVGNLTKIRNKLMDMMKENGTQEDILNGRRQLDESWRKFVSVHESYLELLQEYYSEDPYVLERAVRSYDEQVERKLNLDLSVKLWLEKMEMRRLEKKGNPSVVSHNTKKSQSSVSRASSSSVSQRRERLALAQLNLHKLKLKQMLDEEERAIKAKKELLEAEIEAEKAAVSLKIYEEELDERKNDVDLDLSPYLQPSSQRPLKQRDTAQLSGTRMEHERKLSFTPAITSSHPVMSYPTYTPPLLPKGSLSEDVMIGQPRDSGIVSHAAFNIANGRSCNLTQSTAKQSVSESWSPNWQSPLPHTLPSGQHFPTETQQHDSGLELVQALKQVVVMPKVEYQHFDGDPLKYVTFIHNFETYLERDNPDSSRRLQFLIQHCTGKAREAIESCANLPDGEGYRVAKETLRENFGKPHIIAEAHIKKLLNLPNLKNAGGSTLLEFGRQLDVANRTLTGMGIEYVADLNHMSTLRELAKKLPMFLRAKWTECAGKIIEAGRRPNFQDFVKFIKERAKLVDNEFGQDMNSVFSRETNKRNKKGSRDWTLPELQAFATGAASNGVGQNGTSNAHAACIVCSEQHEIWKCELFKGLPHEEKRKVVQRGGLCNKCLAKGHIAKECPKVNFKCQHSGCGRGHHTLMHRVPMRAERERSNGSNTRDTRRQGQSAGPRDVNPQQQSQSSEVPVRPCNETGAGNSNGVSVAATGAGETRVCLGIIPVKVQGKRRDRVIETYALLDNGSEVTLCHEKLANLLELDGERLKFTLTGMTGSERVDCNLVDLVIKSMDDSVEVELCNVKTVPNMPISATCIAKKEDLALWPHLQGLDIPSIEDGEVSLLIGLKEKPTLFLPLDLRTGGDDEPIAVRYSLGWTVMGPMADRKEDHNCSVNFVFTKDSQLIHGCPLKGEVRDERLREDRPDGPDRTKNLEEENERTQPLKCSEYEPLPHACVVVNEDDDVCTIDNETLNCQLQQLWKTDFRDSVVGTKTLPSVEDDEALTKMNQSLQRREGHFQVGLPWRDNPPYLPNNKVLAERRLDLLRKRLLKDKDLHGKYCSTIEDYVTKGYAQKVPPEELDAKERPVWYLPHHPVTHPLKPGKVRVVFDCAAKYHGTSLNQQLLQGPDFTNPLVGVLIRFRQEPIAVAADIEAMFHQVYVDPRDSDAFRFLWWPNGNLNEQPQEYRMVRHLFGATSSPSVANFCLKKTASTYGLEFDPDVVQTVERNMYVDDLMKSVATPTTAVRLSTQLRELLAKGGFRLTKWLSNDRKVLAEIPETERAVSVANLDIQELPTECALGLKWDVEADKFIWKSSEKLQRLVEKRVMTRRGILAVVSSLFDPLGFIAPYTMKAKLLLQDLCRKKLGWDSSIDELEKIQWSRWLEDLPKLQEIEVDRCFKPKDFGTVKNVQLHIFSDGSRVGYGAVVYLRFVDSSDRIHCSFVLGKARLAPIHEITIPRLELTAAAISVKLNKIIREELETRVDQVNYWTDSTTVLKCINNDTKRFHVFESNRLTIIRSESSPSEWRYVSREDNPADDASKGLKLKELMKNDRWLHGPAFLWKEEACWPAMIKIPELRDSDPEVRKESRIYATTASQDPLDRLIHHFSSWQRTITAIAWLIRFKQFMQDKVCKTKQDVKTNTAIPSNRGVSQGSLKVVELRRAEEEVIRHVQKSAFPGVFKALSSLSDERQAKRIMKKEGSSIFKLNPQLRGGMLSVGGRLDSAPIDEDMKHPFILPKDHHVTELLIRYHHEKLGHLGQESVLSSLREKFWIIKGRSAVRRVLKKCVDCQKWKAPSGEQLMAKLPQDRVTPHEPPFTYVGIDFFGPIEVKQGRSRVKRYGCLFTCLTIRAVHIEVAHSLNTDSMINALRRFINLRGHPKEIRSDCGTNFTRADKELKACIDEWNQQRVSKFCTQRGIEWIFNPPGASHMGGAWERMIRSIRQILKALLGEQVVNDEVLSTVLTEVTNILNSRPLTRNSDDPRDEEPLTPNHLLHLRPCASLPPGIFEKEDLLCRRQWRQAQYLANLFWKRWVKEYLPTLQERKKWSESKGNFKVGDIVLLMDGNFPRGQWPLARVVEVFTSDDGLVRSAAVKTSCTVTTHVKRQKGGEVKATSTVLKRPITKLCRLELSSS